MDSMTLESRETHAKHQDMCQAMKSSDTRPNVTMYSFTLPWHHSDPELAAIHDELNRLMGRLYAYKITEDNDD